MIYTSQLYRVHEYLGKHNIKIISEIRHKTDSLALNMGIARCDCGGYFLRELHPSKPMWLILNEVCIDTIKNVIANGLLPEYRKYFDNPWQYFYSLVKVAC